MFHRSQLGDKKKTSAKVKCDDGKKKTSEKAITVTAPSPSDFVHYWVPLFEDSPTAPPTTVDTGSGAGVPTQVTVDNDPTYYAFMTNSTGSGGTVIPYNTKSGEIFDQISIGTGPYGIAASANGFIYTVCDDGSIWQIDPVAMTVVNSITGIVDPDDGVTIKEFYLIAISPSGNQALVTCQDTSGGVMAFDIIDGKTLSIQGIIEDIYGVQTTGITFNVDGSRAFVADAGNHRVYVLNTTNETQPPIFVTTIDYTGEGMLGTIQHLRMQDEQHFLLNVTDENNHNYLLRQAVPPDGIPVVGPDITNVANMSGSSEVDDFCVAKDTIYVLGFNLAPSTAAATMFLYSTSTPLSSQTPATVAVGTSIANTKIARGIAATQDGSMVLPLITERAFAVVGGFVVPVTTADQKEQNPIDYQSSQVGTVVTNWPHNPLQVVMAPTPIIAGFWSTLQGNPQPLAEGLVMSQGGTPNADRQFGFAPGSSVPLSNTLTVTTIKGITGAVVALEGGSALTTVPIEATFLGGFSRDPNALIYYVIDDQGTFVSGPTVLFPNSKMQSPALPNPIVANCDSKGNWVSVSPQLASRVPLYRTYGTVTDASTGLKLVDPTSPSTSNLFFSNDVIVFALVNYRGQPFNNETLANTKNWRISYVGSTPFTSTLPDNTDVAFSLPGGTNSHFSGQSFASNPLTISDAIESLPPLISSTAVVGSEDRSFATCDGDFQDLVVLLTTDFQTM